MKRILACVDGSNYMATCCQYAAWLAQLSGASLEVVYVTDLRQFEVPFIADLSGSLGLQPYQAVMGQLQELEKQKADIILNQCEKVLREFGHKGDVAKTHKTGFLVDSLKELESNADLIVIGKRGENANFATEHLGSTMERVVRSATKPCFVSSRSFTSVRKILFAYQDVPSCHEAITFIKRQAWLRSFELHLITVSPNQEEEEALRSINKVESDLRNASFDVSCQMLHGIPSQTIAEYCKSSDIDLLIMGAYGHSRIRHLFIGSATTEMLRDCRLPTLLFR
ncbi:universal stress protein [Puniceicoccaceae bacterium K14]|nr:universal stress protein [Puniceicoccaceae bacterium K14]